MCVINYVNVPHHFGLNVAIATPLEIGVSAFVGARIGVNPNRDWAGTPARERTDVRDPPPWCLCWNLWGIDSWSLLGRFFLFFFLLLSRTGVGKDWRDCVGFLIRLFGDVRLVSFSRH